MLTAASSDSSAVPALPATTLQDSDMPQGIPPEIEALLDSYEQGIPVVVIMSRDHSLMPLPLHPKYKYSYMGYFRLTHVHVSGRSLSPVYTDFAQSERVASQNKPDQPDGQVYGRMIWRFSLSWGSGGEDFMHGGSPSFPWWSPDAEEILPPDDMQNSRHNLKKYFTSYLPCQVLEPFELFHGEFPRGWFCACCGRLNEQICLHHRRCVNCQVSRTRSLH
jgi:hypothetical protein